MYFYSLLVDICWIASNPPDPDWIFIRFHAIMRMLNKHKKAFSLVEFCFLIKNDEWNVRKNLPGLVWGISSSTKARKFPFLASIYLINIHKRINILVASIKKKQWKFFVWWGIDGKDEEQDLKYNNSRWIHLSSGFMSSSCAFSRLVRTLTTFRSI